MFVYRIANKKYAHTTLSGIEAEKVGGRWNEVGTKAVYCSENISLALLEYYMHSVNTSYLPKEVLVAKITWSHDFIVEDLTELPKDWNQYPYGSETASIFTNLAKNPAFFALRVPSTIVPSENNIILNPLFSEFDKLRIVEFMDLSVDARLII